MSTSRSLEFRYQFAGQIVTSTEALPELAGVSASASTNAACSIDFLPRRGASANFPATFERQSNGEILMQKLGGGQGALLRFDQTADFLITTDATQIDCVYHPRSDLAAVRHLLIDQVLPRVFTAQGHFMVHAGGIEHQGSAILLVGDSGAGKSTLTAALSQCGPTLLGDDCFALSVNQGIVSALSTYRSLRLLPESAEVVFGTDRAAPPFDQVSDCSPKLRFGAIRPEVAAIPLGVCVIFVLTAAQRSTTTISVERLSQRDVVVQLLRNSFRHEVSCRRTLARALEVAGTIATQTPMFMLDFPWNLDRLDQLAQAVLATADRERP